MIRTAMIALALTLALPGIALAQLYDSGWSKSRSATSSSSS